MLSPKSLQFALFSLTFALSSFIFQAAGGNELDLKGNSAVDVSVTREPFGTTPDGAPVDRYTLTNVHRVRVAILTYGGIVQSIEVPDKNGKLADIALGFDRLDDYIKGGYYFSATIGRYANRIAKGQFTLDGKQYAGAKLAGYDFNWVLNNPGNLNALAARVTDPVSGRTIEMYTTEPGVQFYSGNFLNGTLKGKGGLSYQHWGAFALEARHYPDSLNHANFPSTELKPGRMYTQTTIYRFLPD